MVTVTRVLESVRSVLDHDLGEAFAYLERDDGFVVAHRDVVVYVRVTKREDDPYAPVFLSLASPLLVGVRRSLDLYRYVATRSPSPYTLRVVGVDEADEVAVWLEYGLDTHGPLRRWDLLGDIRGLAYSAGETATQMADEFGGAIPTRVDGLPSLSDLPDIPRYDLPMRFGSRDILSDVQLWLDESGRWPVEAQGGDLVVLFDGGEVVVSLEDMEDHPTKGRYGGSQVVQLVRFRSLVGESLRATPDLFEYADVHPAFELRVVTGDSRAGLRDMQLDEMPLSDDTADVWLMCGVLGDDLDRVELINVVERFIGWARDEGDYFRTW